MNWDDPAIQAAIERRRNSMWQHDVAIRPALRAPEWPPYVPMPGDRIPSSALNPAYRADPYVDPTYFLPALLYGLQFRRG